MSEFTNKPKRAKYSAQFKDQVLERVAKDGVKKAAKDLGLAEALIYSWQTKRKQGHAPLETQKLQQAEFARLKRECARLEMENAFLKKAAAYFAKDKE